MNYLLPTQSELAALLRREQKLVGSTDVRLCIDPGNWVLRIGDPAFDTYHSTICVYAFMADDDDCDSLACEMLEDAEDEIALRRGVVKP